MMKIQPEILPEVPQASSRRRGKRNSKRGFTLIEILVVLGLIGLLAAISMGSMGHWRDGAQRTSCDVQLKTLALALDAFKQENGRYPSNLSDLVARKYLPSAQGLRCPDDPRADGSGSYQDAYVLRSPREPSGMGEVPLLLCPFHEHSKRGVQAYNARFTRQWMTAPANLASTSGADVTRPGKPTIAGASGMELHGGDRIQARSETVIAFVDGSQARLSPGSDVTVLQSFIESNGNQPLYSVVRQSLGSVSYRVHHGSKFDVTTPTATAGARGTEFTVAVQPNGNTTVRLLTPSKLFVSTRRTSGQARQNQSVTVDNGVLGGAVDLLGGVLGGLL